jgi:tRNA (guanine37-N1)-methyltransferase
VRVTVVTLFPEMFASVLDASMLGRARAAGLLEVDFVSPRDFTTDRHRTTDDSPYGGGPGMVMKAEPLLAAIAQAAGPGPAHRILLTPAGRPLQQRRVRELAALPHLVLVCGRYEGIDERVVELAIDEEISLGDFVLTGGELAAMALVDAVARHVPGVLGEPTSAVEESFGEPLLEYPHYTRPADLDGRAVPAVLQSGNHELVRTAARRPDLLARHAFSAEDERLLAESAPPPLARRSYVALLHYPVYDRRGELVSTSLTNLDVHDIARAAATYGLAGYFIVHPVAAQRELVERIVEGWSAEPGDGAAASRVEALAGVRAAADLAAVRAAVAAAHGGTPPHVVATSARPHQGAPLVSALDLIAARRAASAPLLLLFGTGGGLADEVISASDQLLVPIHGGSAFNHLSVRSAVSIVLDRLFGLREAAAP